MNDRPWRVSSYTGNQGDCVEVALGAATTHVRDTKNRTGGEIAVPAASWLALLTEARSIRS